VPPLLTVALIKDYLCNLYRIVHLFSMRCYIREGEVHNYIYIYIYITKSSMETRVRKKRVPKLPPKIRGCGGNAHAVTKFFKNKK
jgi:hypothetical protein